jgi:hypothetical protein
MTSESPSVSTRPLSRFARLRRRPRPRVTATRLSEVLRQLADNETLDRISVGDLLLAMRHRAIGALMFIFAFPNILPTPPGTSTVLGAPVIFLAAQMALGLRPWLPRFIADRSLARADFARFVDKAVPWISKAEKLLKPRLAALTGHPFEYVVGSICFLLAVVLLLPIPLGNAPPAFAICLFALGTLEKDGAWIIAGMIATVISLTVVSGVLYAMVRSAWFLISSFVGF